MKKIKIKGVIVPNDDQWVYEFLGIESTSPAIVEQAIADAAGDDIEVEINSGGGDVFSGSDIYTALKAYGKATTIVTGIAASAASVIAMAGRTVKISPTAQIMIHNVSSIACGDYRDLKHESDVVKNYNDTIANAYVLKTNMDRKELLKMMDNETWLTAQQAKEKGFVDEIMFDEKLQLVAATGPGLLARDVIEKIRNTVKSPANELDFLIQKNSLLRLKGVTNND